MIHTLNDLSLIAILHGSFMTDESKGKADYSHRYWNSLFQGLISLRMQRTVSIFVSLGTHYCCGGQRQC